MSASPPLVMVRTRKSRGRLPREAQAPALPGFRLICETSASRRRVRTAKRVRHTRPRGSEVHRTVRSKTYDERESDEAMAGQKIRIRLKSYDHEVIDSSARKIVDTGTRAGATVVAPVTIPTEQNVFVVISSPRKKQDSSE